MRSKYAEYTKGELIAELEARRVKYGLVWDAERTKEVFERVGQNKFPVLHEIESKRIGNYEMPHILIEGDNYHVLSALTYTHAKKIDVIYIDPPYNIGKEFVYNDKIVDKEDSYKHSKWLSFMSKRLKLARKLLSEKGVIFISIDDNEQAHLRILCDEIFGEKNFIANIVWQKKYSPQNDAKYFSDMHDFVLVYVKRRNYGDENRGWVRNLLPRTDEMNSRYTNRDNDPRGRWKPENIVAKTYSKKYDYSITTPSGRIVNPPSGRCWRVSKTRFKELVKDNRIWFGKTGGNVPAVKKFLFEIRRGVVPVTWWNREFAGHNQDAKQELDGFNLNKIFETPKPVKLIKQILQIASTKDSTVLDFMAGSGTTGQAVLELNANDGGSRKFLLCTNNENSICSSVCYPRIKKVIMGYTNSKKQKIAGLGGSLRYYKTSFVDFETTDKAKKKIVEQSTEMLCLKESCFECVISRRAWCIYKNKFKFVGIVFDIDGIEPFCKYVLKQKHKIVLYYFTLDEKPVYDDFAAIKKYIDLKSIPAGLINTYRRVRRIDRA